MSGEEIPEAGDIIWANFDPRVGHEQSGHRPAVVLTRSRYNARSGMLICCPMTTRQRSHPFEYVIAGPRPSIVLTDQIKSIDWRARGAKRWGRVTQDELADIRARAIGLIGT